MVNTKEISGVHDVITDAQGLGKRISGPVSDPPELVVESIVRVTLVSSLAAVVATIVADIVLDCLINECEHWHVHVIVWQSIIPQTIVDILLILDVDAWLSAIEDRIFLPDR